MQKNIHINAQCPYFSIFEIIPEEKAVSRLRKIKESFIWFDSNVNYRSRVPEGAKLVVKTMVHNPTLF